ncbi:uncharacterized protein LOC123968461 isoform X4 [Micropterus dolomieu]|uniref:uncharacterized protein LOC123968461 isoform X4 n=1 Tax=Micropterus dolomieu TaxID=147949 RepID=UPI001E8CBD20|nr:uncharacterized protein LOC123968461 isoform X4 [Micropterus dolomieu]
MAYFSLLSVCLLSLTQAAAGLQSSDHLVMFALLGDAITLPCSIPSIKSCSSIDWNMAEMFGAVTKVVTAGRVTAPNSLRLGLLKDCSLEINHLVLDDARLYSCDSGALNSSVSLQILELTERPTPADGTIELQCFLNTYKGHVACNNRGIHIKWSTEDNTPLNGNRFHFETDSECFSKLIIKKRLTDHHRKWKCQLTQNDTFKAAISYTTTVKDGIEEVFAAVGESVSLSCSSTSSLGIGGRVEWTVEGRALTDHISPALSPYKGQTGPFHESKDSSLVISRVSALHAGDYQCSESNGQQKVFNKIKLHTLDVISEGWSGGDNVTLTCVLTCAKECEKYFNLTWSVRGHNSWQSSLMTDNNILINRLFLPVSSMTSDELTCFAHREGDVVASKKWHTVNFLKTPAWLALPLGLLTCIAAGGLYVYMKRKHNKDAGNEQSSIEMTHVYEDIQDANDEEQHQQRQPKREAVTTTDSFYDLLQVVN